VAGAAGEDGHGSAVPLRAWEEKQVPHFVSVMTAARVRTANAPV
jgi:hypothetical protein